MRTEYNPLAEATKVLSTLTVEELHDKRRIIQELKKNKIKVAPTTAGRARAAALRSKGESNGDNKPAITGITAKDFKVILGAAYAVGGFSKLKQLIKLAEEIQGMKQ